MKDFIKNNSKIISLLIVVILFIAIGVTFAYTMNNINVSIVAGDYAVEYNQISNNLNTVTLRPVEDNNISSSANVGKIEFNVKGVASNPIDRDIIYDVSLTNLILPKELQSKQLKWRLYKNGVKLNSEDGSFSKEFDAQVDNRMVLTETQQLLPNYNSTADSYTFYVWISETCTGDITICTEENDASALMNKTFSGEIRIELSTGSTKTLNRVKGAAGATLVKLGLYDEVKKDIPDFTKSSPYVTTHEVGISDIRTRIINTTDTNRYIMYSDNYTFDTSKGNYVLKNNDGTDPLIGKYSEIYNNLQGKYIKQYGFSQNMSIANDASSFAYKIISATYDSSTQTGEIEYQTLFRNNYSDNVPKSDTGIFKADDDLGTSYYFRGNPHNNYVKFAGFYWRIIRINGDGTIRIINDGINAYHNGEYNPDRVSINLKFSQYASDNSFVGYMNGTIDGVNFPNGTNVSESYAEAHANVTDSYIKNYLENTWYLNNILNKGYDEYVADAIYCNDRTLAEGSTGVGSEVSYYAAYTRMQNKNPSLKCSRIADRFTKNEIINNIHGNAKLKYPVGLITVDEVKMSGFGSTYNIYNYLYMNSSIWTMTPMLMNDNNEARNGVLYANGSIFQLINKNSYSVKPVISLKVDGITYKGNGTINNPFEIVME